MHSVLVHLVELNLTVLVAQELSQVRKSSLTLALGKPTLSLKKLSGVMAGSEESSIK